MRKFSKPFDLCHSIMFNELEGEYTQAIGVPGVFVKKINRRVRLKNGTGGEIDAAYIADPDYRILFERVAVALEHQSTPVGGVKLDKFGDYDVQLVVDQHLPTLLVVASHLTDENSKKKLIRSPSDITELYFLDLGEENISQRLSTARKIINSNQHVSREIALNLGIIVLYSPRDDACEITEEVIDLYLKIVDDLDFDMEYTLYSVITVMIDAYFDDENEYGRLIDMMDENTSVESKELSASHFSTIESLHWAEEDLAEVKEDLAVANDELVRTNDELAKASDELAKASDELAKASDELAKTSDELSEANSKLAKSNKRISILEAEVKRLTDELNGK